MHLTIRGGATVTNGVVFRSINPHCPHNVRLAERYRSRTGLRGLTVERFVPGGLKTSAAATESTTAQISAPIDVDFQAMLDELGPEGQMPGGKPFPMKIEA